MSKTTSKNLKAKKDYKDWTAKDVVTKLSFELEPTEKKYAIAYIEQWLESVKHDAAEQKEMTAEEYIIASFEAAYGNGDMTPQLDEETEDDTIKDNEGDQDQEIIEVSQTEVKKALKALLIKQNTVIATLYQKHEEYNQQYFNGRLSVPLITIDKMSNKTLGSYNYAYDNAGLENHIYFNRNFIALNTETRILETLRHEMIHQYQDEVLYEKFDKHNNKIHDGDKRPKEWHNKDFKEWAERLGIIANGRNCTGNPAKMPEAKSYNRKFVCGCVATNGYPLTVWSTREIFAICQVCGQPFVEVKKSGGTIEVNQSDIEKQGEDAIESKMRATYNSFHKFEEKEELVERTVWLKELGFEYKEGIYQKGHNAYSEGYHYWIAYNDPEVDAKAEADRLAKLADQERINREAEEKIEQERLAAEELAKTGEPGMVINTSEDGDIVPPKKHRQKKAEQEAAAGTQELGAEPPKKKRGRPAGSKNKKSENEGVNGNDKGNTITEAQ